MGEEGVEIGGNWVMKMVVVVKARRWRQTQAG